MPDTWIALLRGINVGGRNKLPMAALREIFDDIGCEDVRTYIQSGNVVFRPGGATAGRVAAAAADAIAARFGFRVPVVTRTAAELAGVVRSNPFLAGDVDEKALHVAFLDAWPSEAAVAGLDPERSPPDRAAVHGREVYLHLPNGVARTRFTNTYLDRCFATTATVRNWRTIRTLHDLATGTDR